MYARYFTFKAKPGVRSEVEALADQVFGFMKSLQGFVSVHFVISEDEAVYGHLAFGNQNRMPIQPENRFAQERGKHWRS